MRDDPTAEAKDVFGNNTNPRRKDTDDTIKVQFDSSSGDETKSWVVISRSLDRCVTETSAACKQSMYPETVAQQDASSSTERPVAAVLQ